MLAPQHATRVLGVATAGGPVAFLRAESTRGRRPSAPEPPGLGLRTAAAAFALQSRPFLRSFSRKYEGLRALHALGTPEGLVSGRADGSLACYRCHQRGHPKTVFALKQGGGGLDARPGSRRLGASPRRESAGSASTRSRTLWSTSTRPSLRHCSAADGRWRPDSAWGWGAAPWRP